jgi:nitroreductase
MHKPAPADYELHEVIRNRWSPRAFADRSVDPRVLRSLLEAARWAPSGFNSQPWRFVVARREDAAEFERLLGCLVVGNQSWAKHAPVLLLVAARTTTERGDRPNRLAAYEVGLSVAQLTVQATALDLVAHQMGGIDVECARSTYAIPADCVPLVAVALGHPGDPDSLPDELRERELADRQRRPQSEFVFGGAWGKPWRVAGDSTA